jgi:hypothetical protein
LQIVRRGTKTDKLALAPWQHQSYEEITSTYYSASAVDRIVSVSGAGDWYVYNLNSTKWTKDN